MQINSVMLLNFIIERRLTGEYTLRIYAYIKPENEKVLGQIFEKNGNTKVNEKVIK